MHAAAPGLTPGSAPLRGAVSQRAPSLVQGAVPDAGLSALPTASARNACRGEPAAFLRARVRGAASLDVDWQGAALACDGGARPDGRGMRVSFSGTDRGHRLLFIFGIARPARAGVAHDVPTNLTVIFEGERRLYSTAGEDRCSTDELRAEALRGATGVPRLRVRARGYCIAAASALGGGAPLLVSRFDFSGVVLLDASAPAGGRHASAATPAHR